MKINANKSAGQRIAGMRSILGITQETLSDRINDATGILLSQDAIGRYERGERRIDLDTLLAIAIGLDVPVQQLLDGADPRNGLQRETKRQMQLLTPEEHAILRYIATDWPGDRKALILADGVYACLPKHRRREVIMDMMVQVTEALTAGEISPSDLPSGLPYMEQVLGAMYEEDAK